MSDPLSVARAIEQAMNAHDIEAFAALFEDDYESEQPAHPDRAFRGRAQARANWTAMFGGVEDFHAELLRATADGDVAWVEWRWQRTRANGSGLDMAGVTVFGVRDGRLAWGRLYMEPVEEGGAGIDAQVQRMAGTQ
jgi:ketosteroid isomerase-like protein